MNRYLRASLVLMLLALLSACGAAPAAEQAPSAAAPTDAPAAPTAAAPTAAPAAVVTPTFESVADVEPTVGAEPPASAASGALAWRDQGLRNDAVGLTISGLPDAPAGQSYIAWLANKDAVLSLGALAGDANGATTLTFASPDQQNLLGSYEQIFVAQAPADTASAPAGTVVLGGALPAKALVHIRHLLVGIGITPGGVGFVIGLRAQNEELLRHAQFLRDALEANDLALERVHAEHLINIIRGSEARDANGDGAIQNPGDGYGLLQNGQQDGYIKGMVDHARLAAETADATDAIRLHSDHVQIVGENTRQRAEQVRTLAEQVIAAGDVESTRKTVQSIVTLAEQTIQGIDVNGDEQVGPIAGEGGVLTAYQHAQLMASIPLAPQTGAPAAAAPTATAAAPAVAAPTAAAPAEPIAIEVGDDTFAPAALTVPVGATVIWTNKGQRPHTVTADDGSFKSDTLRNGDTFTFTFDKPGTFAYYCDFHGGPGGQGMAATLVVGDAQAAVPAAPAAPDHQHTPAPPAETTAAPAAPAAPAPVVNSMQDFVFAPTEIRVKVGTTVNFRNDGAKPHSATAVDGSFDTGLLDGGQAKELTFQQPGTFAFFCQLHGSNDGTSGMVGTLIVEP